MIYVQYMTIDNQWHTIIFSSVTDFEDWKQSMIGVIVEDSLIVS